MHWALDVPVLTHAVVICLRFESCTAIWNIWKSYCETGKQEEVVLGVRMGQRISERAVSCPHPSLMCSIRWTRRCPSSTCVVSSRRTRVKRDASPASRAVRLTVYPGEFVAMIGKSGSGKSQMINTITGIDRPSSGQVLVGGTEVHAQRRRDGYMAGQTIGVVFEFFQLLPTLTLAENVMLPMDFCDMFPGALRTGFGTFAEMEMAEHAHKLPSRRSRADSSSASPSPGRWPTIRRCSWPTSRPATSTRRPPSWCSAF